MEPRPRTLGGNEEVDRFNHVNEELISAILDAGLSPRAWTGTGDLYSDLPDLFVVSRLQRIKSLNIRWVMRGLRHHRIVPPLQRSCSWTWLA